MIMKENEVNEIKSWLLDSDNDETRYINYNCGKYMLIIESAYAEDPIVAYEITPKAAMLNILEACKPWLLDIPQFVDLKEIYNKEIIQEDSPLGFNDVVPVYKTHKLYAMVELNSLLDKYDNNVFHIGIAKLVTGEYVIIQWSDYQYDSPITMLVSNEEAAKAIRSNNEDLLGDPKFASLNNK